LCPGSLTDILDAGFQLARFFVNELHTFVVSLKDKLDGMEGTVGTGNLLGSAKKRKKEKRTRAPSAFNLFVKEVSSAPGSKPGWGGGGEALLQP